MKVQTLVNSATTDAALRPLAAGILLVSMAAPLPAKLPIEVEVAVQGGAPLDAMQFWSRTLGEADVARVRIRTMRRDEQPSLEAVELGNTKRYRLLGVLTSADVLHLPGAKFGRGDRQKLKAFLEELPVAHEHNAVERGRFGLTEAQFEKVFAAMSMPVSRELKGLSSSEAFAVLTANLPADMVISTRDRVLIDAAGPLTQELGTLSTGTALALVLRRAGRVLVPEHPQGGNLQFRIAAADPSREHWPVGWKPTTTPRQSAPKLYRFRTIEIDGYALSEAITALEAHMGAPAIYDELILAREEEDPLMKNVRLKRQKTFLRRALDGLLSQARLAGEVRVDETGQAFYWITKFGKESPRARE